MKKPLQFFAIILFTLTQLCAPLVHAHIDGIQSDASFHVHEIPRNLSFVGDCHVESYESQAISIPHLNQNDDVLAIPEFCSSSTRPSPLGVALAPVRPFVTFRSASSSCHKPHPQAPPQPSQTHARFPSTQA